MTMLGVNSQQEIGASIDPYVYNPKYTEGHMIVWEDREPQFKGPREFGYNPYGPDARKRAAFERWYDWVMIDWIPFQPDYNQLKEVFISCEYDILVFMAHIQKHSRKHLGLNDASKPNQHPQDCTVSNP
jgi:hypothetical protein